MPVSPGNKKTVLLEDIGRGFFDGQACGLFGFPLREIGFSLELKSRMADEEVKPKKKSGRAKAVKPPPEEGAEPEAPVVEPTTWFGKKQKLFGRPQVRVNEETDEVDVLTLSIHSGISNDVQLSAFMLRDGTLDRLVRGMKSAASHSSKISARTDGVVVTRYYAATETPPANSDPRIAYVKSQDDAVSRWAVRCYLISTMHVLLDDSQTMRPVIVGEPQAQQPKSVQASFRGIRRELSSIESSELEKAESEIENGQQVILMREIICIRRMMHANAEKALITWMNKHEEVESQVRHEQELRAQLIRQYQEQVEQQAQKSDGQIRKMEDSRYWFTELVTKQKELAVEEAAEHREILWDYANESTHLFSRMTHAALRWMTTRRPEVSQPLVILDETQSSLLEQLTDAKLEIARLRDDARGKALPKPKTHRKTKDPDLHMATEADIKSSVKNHMSSYGGGRGLGTPMSSLGSRSRKPMFSPACGPGLSMIEIRKLEEQELEAARKLKALSRSREQDLCNAESASEQLVEVVEALSSILTKVTIIIEDVADRRTAILNHMRSLAMHSRSITGIVKERPYLLGLARRMNHERRPVVNLTPLKALVNVAAASFKSLQQIETITLESIGGVFEVMSLEEAAETGEGLLRDDVASYVDSAVVSVPYTPIPEPMDRTLTRATLRRHTMETPPKICPPVQGPPSEKSSAEGEGGD